jgi:AcrR family transcriptional regulator
VKQARGAKSPRKAQEPRTGKPARARLKVSKKKGPLKASGRGPYHHGNLGEALVEATLHLLKEKGPERVTVREAAKRAGVSSGAPFRHFPTRTALLTAVAEQAMARFRDEIVAALGEAETDEPLARFHALGTAYLRWATRNPMHFRVISDRSLIDFEGSELLRRNNAEIRGLMEQLLADAQRRGLLRTVDVALVPVAAHALVYGLARTYVDGRSSERDIAPKMAGRQMQAALQLFTDSLRAKVPATTRAKTKARARRQASLARRTRGARGRDRDRR